MPKRKKSISPPSETDGASGDAIGPASDRIEFHRNAVALMPEPGDTDPGVAVMVLAANDGAVSHRGCSCKGHRSKTCRHLKALSRDLKKYVNGGRHIGLFAEFQQSAWFRLAELLADADRTPCDAIDLRVSGENDDAGMAVVDADARVVCRYHANGGGRRRFADRVAGSSDVPYGSRRDVLKRLALLSLTLDERRLMDLGMKTRRQATEDTFWYRLAYHAFRELGAGGYTLTHTVDEQSGQFLVSVDPADGPALFSFAVPPKSVDRLMKDAAIPLSADKNIPISNRCVTPAMKIRKDRRGTLRLSPVYLFEDVDGRTRQFSDKQFRKWSFGRLFYVPKSDCMAPVAPPDRLFSAFGNASGTTIPKSDVPKFLQTYGELIRNGPHIDGDGAAGLRVFDTPARVRICPEALTRDWCWLSIEYGFDDDKVSLSDILDARKAGHRYIGVNDGWVDVNAVDTEGLDTFLTSDGDPAQTPGRMKLKRMHLFRLMATVDKRMEIAGDRQHAQAVTELMTLSPATSPPSVDALLSPLRPYQRRGMEWLWFLHENGLGGLLCDDMGLGKTHQVMALMLALNASACGPCLVVCPTTVISHWEKKIREHAPSLNAAVYYGADRCIDDTMKAARVLITSYGVLLRDIGQLSRLSLPLAVFDEIQYVKNAATKTYRACRALTADMKIGLTGTPIENTVWDLKAMMDLVLPGYLGTDADFKRRFAEPVEKEDGSRRRQRLSRVVSPFTLRRLKSSVLDELPEKIEDVRFCTLSPAQVTCYRDALASRRAGIFESLRSPGTDVPYIHIFALLTLLKQICNHPALLDDNPDAYRQIASGKWDLFIELLTESLDSGQKVVVYSQFVTMVRIIERYLKAEGIGHAVLTGQSRNRGRLIARFNEDPACRVFVGSLKAGGTGIDLVAGSVVIHYDRWWNAAKEDQATDRVHRIGQRRGVQVFKLVTEGTLEEKISAIIDAKKDLMESIVREDDPGLLKTFTREDLMALMAFPAGHRDVCEGSGAGMQKGVPDHG